MKKRKTNLKTSSPKRRIKIPWHMTGFLTLLLIVGGLYFLFPSDISTSIPSSWNLVLKDVYVEGRHYLPKEDLLKVTKVTKGQSIFTCDPHSLQADIEKLHWIKSAAVRRVLPNNLYIRVYEREPLALWQVRGKLHLIDQDGFVIPTKTLRPFQDLLIVVGKGAPKNAQTILDLLQDFPQIQKRITAAIFISHRRWDLMLDNKVKIQLPEKEIFNALLHLQELFNRDMIDSNKILAVDLRLKDRSFFYMLHNKPLKTT